MGEPTTPDDRNPRLSEADVRMLVDAIHQMAEFLGNPQAFTDAVRMKLSPLSDDWERILELLPRDAVLGRQNDGWHWLFDVSGRPLPAPQPDVPVADQAGFFLGPPSAQPPDLVQQTRDLIEGIQEVQTAVRAYTDERLDLDKLAVELRLLEVSPPYSAFETAAQNYLAGAGPGPAETPYPSLESDRAILREYSSLIDRSAPAMNRVFFLAELLATQYAGGRNSRTRTYALRLLAEDLDFARQPLARLDAMLAEFTSDFEPSIPPERQTRHEYAGIGPWPMSRRWIDQIVAGVTERNWPPRLPDEVVPEYFRLRFQALMRHMRNRAPLRRLTLRELLLRASDRVAPFHGEPDRLPLSVFAALLFQTTQPHAQSPQLTELVLGLYVKLGFGPQVQQLIRERASPPDHEHAEDLLEAARTVLRGGERVLLIIGGAAEPPDTPGGVPRTQREGSSIATWTLSSRHAVLPVFREMLQRPSALPTVKLDISLVLYEGSPPTELPSWRSLGLLPPEPRIVEVAPAGTTRNALSITETRGLDEAVAEVLKLLPPR